MFSLSTLYFKTVDWSIPGEFNNGKGMLPSVEQVFVGREEIRALLKTPAWEASKPHDFEKLRSPTNAASDWRGADVYLNRVCAKVYKIKVFKVGLEIEQWRLGKANLLGMTAYGSD